MYKKSLESCEHKIVEVNEELLNKIKELEKMKEKYLMAFNSLDQSH